MPGNRKLQRNGSVPDKVEEVMRRLKVEESDDNGRVGDDPGAYPDRPGEPDCIYYLRTGSCGYGTSCRFNHPSNAGQVNTIVYGVKNTSELPERAGQPDCGYYLKTGTCKYGSTCKYHHPKDRQADVLMNLVGLPMRQNTRSCPYYMRTGLCKYGYACKFHHPQPATTTNVLPVIGPVYGSGGSTGAPSPGAPSIGDPSTTPLSKATYFSNSLLQLPQNYIPLFLSPSQGWNTYMGSVAPLSVTSVLTTPASNGQLSASYLPERPDQPECRYFMIHGSCKYGLDCKYHHPKEKISQVASSSLGPLGLPLRPGQPICSYYSLYGLCKYGPTCKFDHPLDGYSYAYSLAVPPLAAAYSSTTPYQRATPLVPLSETSLAKPSRVSDCIKKGETTGNKNQQPKTKNVGDSPNPSDSLPH
ncbi:zinc finger CCCH domain-containing protein 3 isoform X1 [Sesamum indicum]|uniref:Zinc finger CCCH domain-containing protein 3 isoform X1 n=1 Tax=Sesamum indicum TaxID=4182 RepID=A0A6I9TVY8_SESIN|nr:zinc finger CCCH domain-containing protein 3 isoform X1 [Sesamum indicum]